MASMRLWNSHSATSTVKRISDANDEFTSPDSVILRRSIFWCVSSFYAIILLNSCATLQVTFLKSFQQWIGDLYIKRNWYHSRRFVACQLSPLVRPWKHAPEVSFSFSFRTVPWLKCLFCKQFDMKNCLLLYATGFNRCFQRINFQTRVFLQIF